MESRPRWAPRSISTGGKDGRSYLFDMIAPITGDATYVGERAGMRVHEIIPNPRAREQQARVLARGQ